MVFVVLDRERRVVRARRSRLLEQGNDADTKALALGERKRFFRSVFASVDVSSHAKYVLDVCFIFGRVWRFGVCLVPHLLSLDERDDERDV